MKRKSYDLSNLKGMNTIDSAWNVGLSWAVDILNGYLKRSMNKQTKIAERGAFVYVTNGVMDEPMDFGGAITKIYEWNFHKVVVTENGLWIDAYTETGGSIACEVNFNGRFDSYFYGYRLITDWCFDVLTWGEDLVACTNNASGRLSKIEKMVDAELVVTFDVTTPISSDTNLPLARKMLLHNHRVWAYDMGDQLHGSRADDIESATAWSENDDSEEFFFSKMVDYGSSLMFAIPMGSKYIGLVFQEKILVYNMPVIITDAELIQSITISCIGEPVQVGGEWIIPGKKGFKSLSASIASQELDTNDLSLNIENLYQELALQHAICKTYFYEPLNHIYISFVENLVQDPKSTIFVYSVELKEFVGRWEVPFFINCFGEWNNKLYAGTTDGKLYFYSEERLRDCSFWVQDDGTGIPFPEDPGIGYTMSFKPGYLGTESREYNKALRKCSGLITSLLGSELLVKYNTEPMSENGFDTGDVEEETIPLVTGVSSNINLDLYGRGKLIDFEFVSTTGNSIILENLKIETTLEGMI